LELLGSIWLGILQGLTEFLPVSSSGHLVLFQQFVEIAGDDVLFDLVLHVGTLLPAIWFYRKDVGHVLTDPISGQGPFWKRSGVRLALLVVLASFPTAIIGLTFEDVFESLFSNPKALVVTFAITGALLFSVRGRPDGGQGLADVPWWKAVVLGIAQGMAITPGISRSGTTIALALLLGIRREFAVKFSFLMSIPAICGAVIFKLNDVDLSAMEPAQLAVGFVAAAVSGYFALAWLVKLVLKGRFSEFCWYVWALAAATGLYLFVG